MTRQVVTLDIGPMAHGGHCVARYQGRVVFVRHALPGEQVRAVITDGEQKAKFWRADVVEVISASDHRRRHTWRQADSLSAHDRGSLPVGGAEFGHITDAHQRRLKAQVFRDTLARIGDIQLGDLDLPSVGADGELHAEPVEPACSMHWRTRVSFHVTGSGQLAMTAHRSHDLIAVQQMPMAVEAIASSEIFSWNYAQAQRVEVIAPGASEPITLIVHTDAPDTEALAKRLRAQSAANPRIASIILAQRSSGTQRSSESRRSPGTQPAKKSGRSSRQGKRRSYSQLRPASVTYTTLTGERTVAEPLPVPVETAQELKTSVALNPEGFWQIHRGAPAALTAAAEQMTNITSGDSVIDLYAGAGLFTAWAAHRVGPTGAVLAVEAAEASHHSATQLFDGVAQVDLLRSSVERIASRLESADLVIVDPPRSGVGRRAMQGIHQSAPQELLYISCDPASFARDAKQLVQQGWSIDDMRLLDLYPNTHHMESAARFTQRA